MKYINKLKNTICIEPLELPPPIITPVYYPKEVVINICKRIKKKSSDGLFNEAFLNKLLNKCVQIK